MRALGETVPVYGICVRRDACLQRERVAKLAAALAAMIDCPVVLDADDIEACDAVHPPGYGRLNEAVREAMAMAARLEALLLDPVYSGKSDGRPHRPCAFGAHRRGKPGTLHPYRWSAGHLRVRGQARGLDFEGAPQPRRPSPRRPRREDRGVIGEVRRPSGHSTRGADVRDPTTAVPESTVPHGTYPDARPWAPAFQPSVDQPVGRLPFRDPR